MNIEPEQAPSNQGLAQRGSIVDPNTPDFGFPINRKIEVWTSPTCDPAMSDHRFRYPR